MFPAEDGLIPRFVKAAIGRRGIVGSVYSSGVIHPGDTVIAKIPQQRLYEPS
jgi:hypothetical protein